MIRLVRLLLAAAVLWSLYWAAAAWGLRAGVQAWFATRQQEGWQAEYAALETGGFPARHVTRISRPVLADPAAGTAWRAEWLGLESPAIWPGRQTLRFSPAPQRLSYFDQTAVIAAQDMQADLHLAPGSALRLERLAVTAAAWTLSSGAEMLAEADSFTLGMAELAAPATYRITAGAEGLAPKDRLRRRLSAAGDLPGRLETLELQAEVAFDTAWDRRALEQRRPQPRRIRLTLAEAHWGDLRLKAAGTLTVDSAGIPDGQIALQAENWRGILDMAERSGALPPAARSGIERVLGLFAGLGGNPDDLDATLTFKGGYMALGPVPIGPAPRLILR